LIGCHGFGALQKTQAAGLFMIPVTSSSDLVGKAPGGRKLVAVVYTDIVGYSRLIGLDDIGTLERLRTLRHALIDPAINEHGGKIVQTGGDSLLIVFDSIDGAVRCVVGLQRKVPDYNTDHAPDRAIRFRVGINIGDVIADGTDLHGDGVNVAARLQAECPPGGICVSRAVRDHVHGRLDLVFDELGALSLKNIIRPIEAFVVRLERDAADPTQVHAAGLPTPAVGQSLDATSSFTTRPALAVLPFDNLSGDPAEEYFVDGLTEDIITTLAYWRWFPVIARNSTAPYKGKSKSTAQIGKELGAAYLVEGSARRSGNRVRITAQLTDATSGHHLWAQRFDRDISDVFAVQDEIAGHVVISIEPEIHRAELQRAQRSRPEHLGAWDHLLKALTLQERMSRSGHREARDLLDRALALEPGLANGWSMLATCHYHEAILGWAEDRNEALKRSLAAAERAVELDELDWLGHAMRGMGHLWTARDHAMAREGQERAVTLNPSAPLARHFLACVLEFSQRPAEALPHLQAVRRLDPRYRFESLALADEALCHFLLGDLEAALAAANKAVRLQPSNVRARQRLVVTLSALGRDDEARSAAGELTRMQPDLSVDYINVTYPFEAAADRRRFIDMLRPAGLASD
jgi:adenylate cyclase